MITELMPMIATHAAAPDIRLTQAFPDTPWAFIFRQPVQTMMSHLDPQKNNQNNAPCMRSKRHPPNDVSTCQLLPVSVV